MARHAGDKPPLSADSYERPVVIDLGALDDLTRGIISTDVPDDLSAAGLGRSPLSSL